MRPDQSGRNNRRSRRGLGLRGAFGVLASLALAWVWGAMSSAQVRDVDTDPIRPTIPQADRYQKDRVFLERADLLLTTPDVDYQIVVGNVEFRKGDMFMYCDSAHFYEGTNSINAFGNVRMEQGDTLFVFADELVYTDSTQLAILYSDPGKKVRLINRDTQLETDIFNYDLGIELGYYEVYGVLTDKQNKLTSWYGEYSPATKDALFKDQVHLNSLGQTDTLEIFTEELLYNTLTHVAVMDTTSRIINGDGTIYTTSGTYNTETTFAELYKRSLVVAKNGNTLVGDTLYFTRDTGIGFAYGNIEMTDTTNKTMLLGDYGFYDERADSALVTGRALAKEFSRPDTLYLHGDTIRSFRVIDSLKVDGIPPVFDSLGVELVAAVPDRFVPDTTHHIVANPLVRFWRVDIQGICDSMTFVQRDSVMWMNRHPVVWNENKQIFGNVIQVHLNDTTVDWARLPDFGFMAENVEDNFFNQLTGKEMLALFDNGELRHLDVSGNVQAIMLPQENDSTYNKIANVESSFMAADFKNQTIDRMKMWPESNGTVTPLYLAKKSLFFLPQFRWFEPMRPTSPESVFVVPKEMIELMQEPETTTTRQMPKRLK